MRKFVFGALIIIVLSVVAALTGLITADAAFAAGSAVDATASAASSTVSLSPIIGTITTLLSVVITGIGGVALKIFYAFLKDKAGIELDAQVRAYLDQALTNAVSYGKLKVEGIVDANTAAVDVHSEVVAQALDYITAQVPDALAHFGIDDDGLKRLIEARLLPR